MTYKDLNQFGFNYMTDVYGEEDYYTDFGTIFPKVIELFYERRLDDGARPSKIRFELLQRDLDSGSGADFGDTGPVVQMIRCRKCVSLHQRLLNQNNNEEFMMKKSILSAAVLSLAVTELQMRQRSRVEP